MTTTPNPHNLRLDTLVELGNTLDSSRAEVVDAAVQDLVNELFAVRRVLLRLREHDPARAERLVEALEDELVELIDL